MDMALRPRDSPSSISSRYGSLRLGVEAIGACDSVCFACWIGSEPVVTSMAGFAGEPVITPLAGFAVAAFLPHPPAGRTAIPAAFK
jgi:hypothetical protein